MLELSSKSARLGHTIDRAMLPCRYSPGSADQMSDSCGATAPPKSLGCSYRAAMLSISAWDLESSSPEHGLVLFPNSGRHSSSKAATTFLRPLVPATVSRIPLRVVVASA